MASHAATWTTHNKFSSDPAFFGVVNHSTLTKIIAELDTNWDMRKNLMDATQMWDARQGSTGLVMPTLPGGAFNPNASLYELNYSMLKACSDYYQDVPPFDALRPAADAPIAEQLEYLFRMKNMAKAIVGGMWGQELPDMTYADYVRIFQNATCCAAGTFNRANHGYNFGKCEPCGYGYWCQGGTHRDRCSAPGTYTKTDKAKSAADCELCKVGHYCPTTDKIIACPAGKWTNGVGKTSPSDCVDGPAGWYYPGDGERYECPVGSFCDAGSAAPAYCPHGTWSDVGAKNSGECVPALCQPGNAAFGVFCENGSKFACPNGFQYINPTSNATPRTFVNVCFECGWAGGFGLGASATWGDYPNSAPTTISAYCRNSFVDGAIIESRTLCPAGTWTNPACQVSFTSGNAELRESYTIGGRCSKNYSDCVDCPAGYLCPTDGSWPFAPNNLCREGYWCPKGTTGFADMREHGCPQGTWSVPGTGLLSQCTASLCGAGNWCAAEKCANGIDLYNWPVSWCNDNARTNETIRRACPAGYFCTGDGFIRMCEPGYFCEEGTSALAPANMCPDNMWSLPGARNASECMPTFCEDGYLCANAQKVLCPAGQFCVAGMAPGSCPIGKYCPEGTTSDGFGTDSKRPAIDCPVGTWTLGAGSTKSSDCQGSLCGGGNWCDWEDASITGGKNDCPAGFYCNEGAIVGAGVQRIVKTICPAGSYCPTKSALPTACDDAKWSTPGRSGSAECTACEAGYKCSGGEKTLCPAGYFCEEGKTPEPCTEGMYCQAGDRYAPRNCPAGTWVALGQGYSVADCTPNNCGLGNWCENGGKAACPQGFACGNGAKTLCEAGKYCQAGSAVGANCDSGTWSRPGAWLANGNPDGCFAAECGVGYWCDAGNRFPCGLCTTADACYSATGANSAYCPGDGAKYRCPAGSWCDAPEWQPRACPAGTTSPAGSNKSADCAACASGTWSASGDGACANNKCPIGKYSQNGEIKSCQPGQFCNNCAAANCANGEWSGFESTSCSAAECGTGNLCDGTGTAGRKPCSAGYFCPNPTTQTICPDGRFCPEGSSAPSLCPAGTWTNGTGSTKSSDCIEPDNGQYYPGDGTQNNCVAGNYCPKGSSAPIQCPAGTWSAAANNKTAADCAACAAGTWSSAGRTSPCTDTCPTGFYCLGDRVLNSCAPGHRCPGGNTNPTPCPAETFNGGFGLGGACTNCPAGQTTNGLAGFISCMACPAGFTCAGGSAPVQCAAGKYCTAGLSAAQNCAPGTWSFAGSTREEDCLSVNPSNILASSINTASGVRGFSTYYNGANCVQFAVAVAALNGVPNQALVLDEDFMVAGAGLGYSANCAVYTITSLSGSDHFWGGGRGLAVACGASANTSITSATSPGGTPRWRVFNTDGTMSQIYGWPSPTIITLGDKLVNFTIGAANCATGFTNP